MGYEAREADNRRYIKDFYHLPYLVYNGDRNWVAPIISEVKRILHARKNPYFKNAKLKLFNCYLNESICSRVAIIISESHFKKFGTKTAYFGFFETLNDAEAVKVLFNAAEDFCRQESVERLEGPFNPNHYSELGLLTNKFDKPVSFFQTYNPNYYLDLLKLAGFTPSQQLHTRLNSSLTKFIKENFEKPLPLEIGEYKIRHFINSRKATELENLREIYNDAFSSNWHFIPVSQEEYVFASKYLSLVTRPNHIIFVEHKTKPIAVIHFALDINPLLKEFNGKFSLSKYIKLLIRRRKIDKLIIFAVGIKKAYQCSRVSSLLFNAAVETMRKYKSLETTWMYQDNLLSIRVAEKLGLESDKKFVILQKTIC